MYASRTQSCGRHQRKTHKASELPRGASSGRPLVEAGWDNGGNRERDPIYCIYLAESFLDCSDMQQSGGQILLLWMIIQAVIPSSHFTLLLCHSALDSYWCLIPLLLNLNPNHGLHDYNAWCLLEGIVRLLIAKLHFHVQMQWAIEWTPVSVEAGELGGGGSNSRGELLTSCSGFQLPGSIWTSLCETWYWTDGRLVCPSGALLM